MLRIQLIAIAQPPHPREFFTSSLIILPSQTTQVTHQDGMQTYHFPNGQIENHYTDGRKEITFPDNSTRIVHTDGSSDTVFADGVRVMDYPDGRQVVVQP